MIDLAQLENIAVVVEAFDLKVILLEDGAHCSVLPAGT
jgi:hypothetical protein